MDEKDCPRSARTARDVPVADNWSARERTYCSGSLREEAVPIPEAQSDSDKDVSRWSVCCRPPPPSHTRYKAIQYARTDLIRRVTKPRDGVASGDHHHPLYICINTRVGNRRRPFGVATSVVCWRRNQGDNTPIGKSPRARRDRGVRRCHHHMGILNLKYNLLGEDRRRE